MEVRPGILVNVNLCFREPEKSHKCEFCAKSFFCSYDLRKHWKEHVGEPLKCSLCNKSFGKMHNLQRHMRIHSETLQLFSVRKVFFLVRRTEKTFESSHW